MSMTDRQLREALRRETVDGKVACTAALKLAKRTGTAPKEIGRICNEMGIRICACQLGCFR